MRILIASSEVYPYSKTGGLADMVGSLAKYLAVAGNTVGVVSPYYRVVREQFPDAKPFDWDMDLEHGATRVRAGVKVLQYSDNLTFYFIEEANFFDRDQLYQSEGFDYVDNADRFIFFSKAAAHLARYLPWKPEIIHAHDWQTGLIPLFVRHQANEDGWENPPSTVMTIHNLAYQGNFPAQYYILTNLPDSYFNTSGVEFYGNFSCLKAGILFADSITTVSPKYAREILTKEYGCGMDGVLQMRGDILKGILNGVDYEVWNTTSNLHFPLYRPGKMTGKRQAKLQLQKEMKLTQDVSLPIFGNISRLVHQKGSDLIIEALKEKLKEPIQFVLLGSGSSENELGFQALAKAFPKKVGVRIGYDQTLAQQMEAGCDFFLMPSRFEPCGLNQMYSLKYGTLPIVRRTGGLDDSVIDATDNESKADGFKFDEPTAESLMEAMDRALTVFKDKTVFNKYRDRAMNRNFSWSVTAQAYLDLYEKVRLSQGRESIKA